MESSRSHSRLMESSEIVGPFETASTLGVATFFVFGSFEGENTRRIVVAIASTDAAINEIQNLAFVFFDEVFIKYFLTYCILFDFKQC